MERLKENGIEDITCYLHEHPDEANYLARQVKILDVNQATLNLYKAESKEDFFQGLSDIFVEESLKDFVDDLEIIFSEQAYFISEIPQRTLTGELIQIQLHWSKIPGYEESLEKVLVAIVDITEKTQIETMLRKTQARLEEAQRVAQASDWEWYPDTNQVAWSRQMYHILGLDPAFYPPNYEGQLELYDPEDAKRMHEAVSNALASGTPYELELNRTKPDGSKITVLAKGLVQKDDAGKVTKLYGSVQDITKQKQVQEA